MARSNTAEQLASSRSSKASVGVFTFAVFWSAVLLFILEPLFAKLVLPQFGGSPSVWLTCMVFFQVSLLFGYFYSHVLAARLTKTRIAIHLAGLILSCLALPVAVRMHMDPRSAAYHPSLLLLAIAVASIGLPFFFLATSSPLLQRWFSHTNEPDAEDPYFLYAASNAGSLLGLALYPIILEPKLGLSRQAIVWSAAYLVFLVLIAICAVFAYRSRSVTEAIAQRTTTPPNTREELLWIGLAFVPASLLYGVTSQLSIDFPPVPLLWIVPLAIYLLTFIIGFSPGFTRLRGTVRLLPTILVASAALYTIGTGPAIWALTGVIKLLCFGAIALAMHSELARRRPDSQYLTRFFLLVSLGGVLAGILAGLVAPFVFSDYWEFPIALLLGAALLPSVHGIIRKPINTRLLWSVLTVVCTAAIATRLQGVQVPLAVRWAAFLIAALLSVRVPTRLTVIPFFVMLLFAGHLGFSVLNTIYQARSFYGVYKVTTDSDRMGTLHSLVHGTTVHGVQRVDDPTMTGTPGYYAPVQPIIAIARESHPARVGVVGLGAGTSSCYAAASDSMTYFEIDPLIEKIAQDPRFFTYLSKCPGTRTTVLGDARLTLADVPSQSFNVLIIDAFTSDAIPMHLLTREAFNLYRRTLASDGILMVHVSNRYIDLQPVVQGSASIPGYVTMVLFNRPDSSVDSNRWNFPSKWMVLAAPDRVEELKRLGWQPASGKSVTWTDDRSSLVNVVAWSKLVDVQSLLSSIRQSSSSGSNEKLKPNVPGPPPNSQ